MPEKLNFGEWGLEERKLKEGERQERRRLLFLKRTVEVVDFGDYIEERERREKGGIVYITGTRKLPDGRVIGTIKYAVDAKTGRVYSIYRYDSRGHLIEEIEREIVGEGFTKLVYGPGGKLQREERYDKDGNMIESVHYEYEKEGRGRLVAEYERYYYPSGFERGYGEIRYEYEGRRLKRKISKTDLSGSGVETTVTLYDKNGLIKELTTEKSRVVGEKGTYTREIYFYSRKSRECPEEVVVLDKDGSIIEAIIRELDKKGQWTGKARVIDFKTGEEREEDWGRGDWTRGERAKVLSRRTLSEEEINNLISEWEQKVQQRMKA
jgi:hypothetical protein